MFKLYIDKGTRKMIDVSQSEQDIIDTMGDYLRDDVNSRFLIIENTEEGDWVKDRVIGWTEYATYVEEYNRQLKEKSCVELKSEIVKKAHIKIKGLKR